MFTYKYPRASVTVDMVIISEDKQKLLLIKRLNEPFKDCWALPGGFIEMEETLEESAIRELREETSLSGIKLTMFNVFGNPGRDPRGRTITIAYYGICKSPQMAAANDDAKELKWFPINELPNLAFDHKQIIDNLLNNNNLIDINFNKQQ
ncbi:MAG: NUDIX hydrolase [Bacteroidales bacterium]|nr:NUDIX hydrolase [Bacteroidales bacterium]